MNDFLDSIDNVFRKVTFSEQIQEKQISFAYSTTEDSFDRAVFRSTSQETLLDNEAISKGLESIDFSFDEPNLDESDEPIKEVSGKELSSDPPSSLFDFPNQNEKSESIEQKSPERKEFSWDAITTPKTNQDPFVDDETVKASKVKQFVIKSPFSNAFSNMLNAAKEPSPFEIDVLEEQFKESFAEELKELTESESGQSQYSHEETPSQVLDDFFLLKQNQTLDLEKEEFQNAEILLQENFSSRCSFLSESSVKDLQEVKATESTEELQTPQTNSRTLPSFQDELFSPGSFFASRSGNLGKLGGPGNIDRPMWYTPKLDPQGRLIDLIGQTPAERKEKIAATPAGNRVVRPPLYAPTPKDAIRVAPSNGSQIEPLTHVSPQQQVSTIDHIDISTFELKSTSLETSLPESTRSDLNARRELLEPVDQEISKEMVDINSADMIVFESDRSASFKKDSDLSNDFSDIPEYEPDASKENVEEFEKSVCDISVQTESEVQEFEGDSVLNDPSVQVPEKYLTILKIPPKPSQRVSTKSWALHYAIQFEITKKACVKRKICILNCCSSKTTWTLKQVGPAKFTAKDESHLVDEVIFQLDAQAGKLDKSQHQKIVLTFFPIRNGTYSALFQMKANGYVIQCSIEVIVGPKKVDASSSFSSSAHETSLFGAQSDFSSVQQQKSVHEFDLKKYLSGKEGISPETSQMFDSITSSLSKGDTKSLSKSASPTSVSSTIATPVKAPNKGLLNLTRSELVNLPTPKLPKLTLEEKNALLSQKTPVLKKWKTLPSVDSLLDSPEAEKDTEMDMFNLHRRLPTAYADMAKKSEPPHAKTPTAVTPASKKVVEAPVTAIKITKKEPVDYYSRTPYQSVRDQPMVTPAGLDPMTPRGYQVQNSPPVITYNLMTPKPQDLTSMESALPRGNIPPTPMSTVKLRAKLNQTNIINIDFGQVQMKQPKTMNLKICNPDRKEILVKLAVTGDFSIPIREIKMAPRSYALIPIRLNASIDGSIREMLVIQKGEKMKRIHLLASAEIY